MATATSNTAGRKRASRGVLTRGHQVSLNLAPSSSERATSATARRSCPPPLFYGEPGDVPRFMDSDGNGVDEKVIFQPWLWTFYNETFGQGPVLGDVDAFTLGRARA